jgi:hypothetical protein
MQEIIFTTSNISFARFFGAFSKNALPLIDSGSAGTAATNKHGRAGEYL